MFHFYTYGRGSIQFLILRQKGADLVNEFTNEFFDAQRRFNETHGRHWTPSEPLEFNADYADGNLAKYNRLTKSLNFQHAVRNRVFSLFRIDVKNEEFEDYLIKRF